MAYEENSAVYYNSKTVWLQENLLKEGKLKKRLDFKQVLGVGWQCLMKAVLPALVQGFREQQLPGCLVALQFSGWICSLHWDVLRCVSSHKRYHCYLAKRQCVCCCHSPFCWQVRSCSQSSHWVVSRSCPHKHMENTHQWGTTQDLWKIYLQL